MKRNNSIPTNFADILKFEKSNCWWGYQIRLIIIKYVFGLKSGCNFDKNFLIINLNRWIINYDLVIPPPVKNSKIAPL